MNPMTVSDSSLAFDGNDDGNGNDICDLTLLDDTQFLSKLRRRKACPNPERQLEKPSDPGKNDPFGFGHFAENQLFKIFPEFIEICPPYLFGSSNTPVCKDISNGEIIRVPGVLPVTLLNVAPRTSCSPFLLH